MPNPSERGILLQDDFDPGRRALVRNISILLGVAGVAPGLLACRLGGLDVGRVSDTKAIADILAGKEAENNLPLRIFPISVQRLSSKPKTEIKAKVGHEWFYITFGFYNRSDKDIEMDTYGIPMDSPLIKGRININGQNYYVDDVQRTLAFGGVVLPPGFGFTQVNGEVHAIGFEVPKGARITKMDMPEFGEMDLTRVVDQRSLKFPTDRPDSEFRNFESFTYEVPNTAIVEIGEFKKIGTEEVKFGWADQQRGDFDVYELPHKFTANFVATRQRQFARLGVAFIIFGPDGNVWSGKPGIGRGYSFGSSGMGQKVVSRGVEKIYLPIGLKSAKLFIYGDINEIFNLRLG